MSVYLVALKKPPLKAAKTKAPRRYWVLRETVWEPGLFGSHGGIRHRYVTALGFGKPVLTLNEAKQLCREKGLTLEALQRIKGLQIVEDEPAGGEDTMRQIQRSSRKGSG